MAVIENFNLNNSISLNLLMTVVTFFILQTVHLAHDMIEVKSN
jgi:hypothetical protein